MRKKFIIFLIGIFLFGCSANRYMLADKYLEQEDYKSALTEYIRLAKASGPLNLSKDIRALTGAMIAYYSLGEYKKSFALSKRILSLQSYNSAAIFYAGLNLEQKNKFSLAKKIYRYYQVLPESDPYYNLIKARFNLMVQKEMEERAKLAIKMEKSVGVGKVIDNTVAVLYFVNATEDPRWNALSKGLAEMMITDLSQVKKLKVIERIHFQKLLEEMELGMSGLADESTAPRMGRLLRAKNLVNGSFVIKAGRNLTISEDLVDVTQAKDYREDIFRGQLKDILDIEKKIVFNTLDKLKIKLTKEERNRIKKNTTKSLQAFLAFCNGLDKYDFGDYDAASAYFQQAIKYDPKFKMAKNMAEITAALKFVERGKFMAKHPLIVRKRKFASLRRRAAVGQKFRGRNFAKQRLRQLSINLDMGYLPGNESRNGSSEIISEPIFDQLDEWQSSQELLPEPPKPPQPPN